MGIRGNKEYRMLVQCGIHSIYSVSSAVWDNENPSGNYSVQQV